ncbi:hypothetical protein I6F31_05095 [Bradyrhizobium sp. NBAIM01]|nr:hypothetical protein [Bradyrhizobium sp. NBAIM01]
MAYPRFLARTCSNRPYAARIGFEVSLPNERMDEYAKLVRARIKAIDARTFAIILGHGADGNLRLELHHEHTPDRREDFEKACSSDYRRTSISAEHGIGILKRPYLNVSRRKRKSERCVR